MNVRPLMPFCTLHKYFTNPSVWSPLSIAKIFWYLTRRHKIPGFLSSFCLIVCPNVELGDPVYSATTPRGNKPETVFSDTLCFFLFTVRLSPPGDMAGTIFSDLCFVLFRFWYFPYSNLFRFNANNYCKSVPCCLKLLIPQFGNLSGILLF